jgi:hypothetical protein
MKYVDLLVLHSGHHHFVVCNLFSQWYRWKIAHLTLSNHVNLGRSMLFNFVIDLKSIRLQILVSHTVTPSVWWMVRRKLFSFESQARKFYFSGFCIDWWEFTWILSTSLLLILHAGVAVCVVLIVVDCRFEPLGVKLKIIRLEETYFPLKVKQGNLISQTVFCE